MPTNQQLPVLGNLQTGSRMLVFPSSSVAPIDLSSSSISISDGQSSQAHGTVFTPRQLVPSTIAGIGVTPPPHSSVNIVTQNLLPSFTTTSPVVSQTESTQPVNSSADVVPQSQLSSVNEINTNASTLDFYLGSREDINTSPAPTMVSPNTLETCSLSSLSDILDSYARDFSSPSGMISSPFPSNDTFNTNATSQGWSPSDMLPSIPPTPTFSPEDTSATLPPSPSSGVFDASARTRPILSQSSSDSLTLLQTNTARLPSFSRSMSTSEPGFSSITMTEPVLNVVPGNNSGLRSGAFQTDINTGQANAASENEIFNNRMLSAAHALQPAALHALADVTMDRGPHQESEMSDTRSSTNHLVQVWIFQIRIFYICMYSLRNSLLILSKFSNLYFTGKLQYNRAPR